MKLTNKYICLFVFTFFTLVGYSNPIDSLGIMLYGASNATEDNVKIPFLRPEDMPVKAAVVGEPVAQSTFSFESLDADLDKYINASAPVMIDEDPNFAPFMISLSKAGASDKVKKVKELCEKAIDLGNFIDKLTGGDLVTMPVVKRQKIGEQDFYLIFQSAKIYPNYAELEVYAMLDYKKKDFNGKNTVLYFGGTGIKFSQEKGIIAGNIALLEDYGIKLSEQSNDAGLYIKKMTADANGTPTGGTYVSFDCDGFKELGFGGKIFFSRKWAVPTDEFGVPRAPKEGDKSTTTPRVHADIQVIAQSWEDLYITASIDHFKLTKWKQISIFMGECHVDLSSHRSPKGTPYNDVNDPLWQGVYVKEIGVTLPKPFKRNKNSFGESQGNNNSPPVTDRIKVSAEHLAIDQSGVSGIFSIEGQVPLIGGAIADGEWGFSLDQISLVLEDSDVAGFGFGGKMGVPILSRENPLDYTALYTKLIDPNEPDGYTEDYTFNASLSPLDKPKTFPIFNAASVMITTPSINLKLKNGEFTGAFICSGVMTLGTPKDLATDPKGSLVKMPAGITFTNLRVATRAPYLTVGSLGLNAGSSQVSGFPVTVNTVGMSPVQNEPDKVDLNFSILIKLMKSEENIAEATGDFAVRGLYKRDANGARYWTYDNFFFNGAEITISVPQFYCHGTLDIMRGHEVYGDGFSASVVAEVIGDELHKEANVGKFEVGIFAIFGTSQNVRYWMVDGFVGGEGVNVPLFGPFYLNGFGGGAFHHMKPYKYSPQGTGGPGQSLSGIEYLPAKDTKLGITFSTSISTHGNLMNGLLTCIIRFDKNMALQNITLWGTAEIMLPGELGAQDLPGDASIKSNAESSTKSIEAIEADSETEIMAAQDGIFAKIGISLDFTNNVVFHAFADVSIKTGSGGGPSVVGQGTLDILIDANKKKWHFWLGGYYDGSTKTTGFLNPDEVVHLYPVTVSVNYDQFTVSAHAYFLTGNDIPGPPPMADEALAFFGPEADEDNRGLLTCAGRDPVNGTGIAFGASAFIDFEKTLKGLFGSCVGGLKVDIGGGLGFDLALLRYPANSQCSISNEVSHGIRGYRATGRVFVFLNIDGGHFTCFPLPKFGIGAKIRFDITKPSFFEMLLKIDVGKEFEFEKDFGDECGTLCPGMSN